MPKCVVTDMVLLAVGTDALAANPLSLQIALNNFRPFKMYGGPPLRYQISQIRLQEKDGLAERI
jgi:hypothetical protein